MDVKPWDDETDMKKLDEAVRSVQMEGLLWGASKLVPVGYGIKKLQIMICSRLFILLHCSSVCIICQTFIDNFPNIECSHDCFHSELPTLELVFVEFRNW